MANFKLPFGPFQIHFAASTVARALGPLQQAIRENEALLDAAYAENPDLPVAALAGRIEKFEASINRVKKASEDFERALRVSEFPEVLPQITVQLIYASIVADAFHLSFEVLDYVPNVDQSGKSYWWVTGCAVDRRGRTFEEYGTSFTFDQSNEKMAEGALLSACADAFIHCIFAAVPHFPWDRWNIVSTEGNGLTG